MTRAIFLVGFMGAGKSTVGAALARRLKWAFIDLDDVIVARVGKSVPKIFSEEGEARFREHETEALSEVIDRRVGKKPTVVALGGGCFVQARNLALLRAAKHPTVFLDADLAELRKRCVGQLGTRPLFREENQFRQLYEARRNGYMEADLRVDTVGKTVDEIVIEVLSRLELHDDFSE
ncbi:MAG: shikimate kinase [Terriglobales bacterium]